MPQSSKPSRSNLQRTGAVGFELVDLIEGDDFAQAMSR
jgi:hypothetical protein